MSAFKTSITCFVHCWTVVWLGMILVGMILSAAFSDIGQTSSAGDNFALMVAKVTKHSAVMKRWCVVDPRLIWTHLPCREKFTLCPKGDSEQRSNGCSHQLVPLR